MALPRGAKQRAPDVLARLNTEHPPYHCFLHGREDPFRLLTAVILSAQCTDEMVNKVTPDLFDAFPTPQALAEAPRKDVERLIYSTGFYRAKARHIQEMAADVVERFGGEVSGRMEDLVTLRGVGRKTANVVLAYCFGIAEGVCVDTHVGRIARRTGLTREQDPVKVEQDLMRLFPREDWPRVSYHLILHGRRACDAKAPACGACSLLDVCPRRGLPRGVGFGNAKSAKSAKATKTNKAATTTKTTKAATATTTTTTANDDATTKRRSAAKGAESPTNARRGTGAASGTGATGSSRGKRAKAAK